MVSTSDSEPALLDESPDDDYAAEDYSDDIESGSMRLAEQAMIYDKLQAYVRENLEVSAGGDARARDANVVNVAFRHFDPEEARIVTQAVVDQYKAFVKEKFQNVDSEAAKLISDARSALETEIKQSEDNYKDFLRKSPMMAAGETSTNVYQMRYEELAAELSIL